MGSLGPESPIRSLAPTPLEVYLASIRSLLSAALLPFAAAQSSQVTTYG
jgi:hypothetical protein